MLRTFITAAFVAGIAFAVSPVVAADKVAAPPLQEVHTLAQWKEVEAISTSEPVVVLFVKADGSHLEQTLQEVAPKYSDRLKIVKIVLDKTRVSAEVLSAAGSCSWSIATSDEETNTVACTDLFSLSPLRLTVYQGAVKEQTMMGDLLTAPELEQSLDLSVLAVGHGGKAI